MKTIKISNILLYDGIGNKIENTCVVFNEKILGIGADAVAMECDIEIDGSRKCLIPGLIECHCHLTVDANKDFGEQNLNDSPVYATVKSIENCKKFLTNGVTSARSLGSKFDVDIEIRDMVEMGIIKGPNLIVSGTPLTMTGGHGWAFSQEVDGTNQVLHAARVQIKKGADVIKLFASGGGMTKGVKPGAAQLSEAEMKVACIEAEKTGKTTAAHSQSVEGNKNAIRAGITSIEHGVGLDEEAVTLMKEKGTYLVPTLSAPYNTVKYGAAGGVPEWAIEKNREAVVPLKEAFQLAMAKGVNIAMGTDAGTPFNQHGDVATEIELMHEYGMTIEDILISATSKGAKLLQIFDKTGSVAIGKDADLLLLYLDPAKDIAAFRSIVSVYKRGELIK